MLTKKTTVVTSLGEHPGKQGVLVYDLRTDPETIANLSPAELATKWRERVEDETKRFPVKTMQFNRCPAVAPMGVLDKASQEHIKIDLNVIEANRKKLASLDLRSNLLAALKLMDKQQQATFLADQQDVDAQLYDGFFGDQDRTRMSVVRAAEPDDIGSVEFQDPRLKELLPLYKARNFMNQLSGEEREAWEAFRTQKLLGGGDKSLAAKFFNRLGEIAQRTDLSGQDQYLLEELQLYGQSILPMSE